MTDSKNWLRNRINGNGPPLLIDGGMGTQLQHCGVPMDGNVWSGRAVLSHPDAVVETHEAFIRAGAEVIIANTFASARHMLEPGGLGDYVEEINLNAVKLAKKACDNVAEQPVAIAGSICEWAPTDDAQWHNAKAIRESSREQAGLLAEAGVDLIALEMCEEIELSIAVIEATLETGLPIWIGMSAKRHKDCKYLSVFDSQEQDFESLVKALAGYPAMLMNIMHTPIVDIDEAIDIVKKYWHGAIGVYPESGYFNMPDWQFVDIIEPGELAGLAQAWIDKGIRMMGGCCGLGPAHIIALRRTFFPP